MKQIYIIVIFLLPFPAFSQLYIQPYQNNDSFIFVEGELLFVEKQIDLTINPSENRRASIYLRKESQLLQGSSNTPNSGNGLLSVFQEGDATAFTYNYWGLPVQDPQGPRQPAEVIYEPIDRTNSRKAAMTSDYNGSSNPLKISGRWIYKLSGGSYYDWVHIGNSFDLRQGEGFIMKGVEGKNMEIIIFEVPNNPGNRQRYDFRGRPNNGEISIPVQKEQILLVGNPYPSALDLNTFLQDNFSTTGIAYFWDSSSINSHYLTDYEGGYGAYSPGAGSNGYVPAAFSKYDRDGNLHQEGQNRGGHYARSYSPIGQGFIVEGAQDGRIIFKNEYRDFIREKPGTSEFKASNLQSGIIKNLSMLRLNVEFDDTFVRQLLLFHHPLATNKPDHGLDAKNILPLQTDAGWDIEEQEFIINADQLNINDEIPLIFHIAKEQKIMIELESLNNIDSDIFIFDAGTKEYYDLNGGGKFSVKLEEGAHKERFYLTFKDDKEVTGDLPVEELSIPLHIINYSIFQNNPFNRLEIRVPLLGSPEKIELFDITGRKLREQKGEKGVGYYEFYTRNLSRGIFVIKITGKEGTIVSKKVLISN